LGRTSFRWVWKTSGRGSSASGGSSAENRRTARSFRRSGAGGNAVKNGPEEVCPHHIAFVVEVQAIREEVAVVGFPLGIEQGRVDVEEGHPRVGLSEFGH